MGFGPSRVWGTFIKYNNYEGYKLPLDWKVAIITGMSIFGSLARASDVFSPEFEPGKLQDNFFDNHLAELFVGTVALITLNAMAILRKLTDKNVSDVPSTIDKFLVVVWKATPYLMLVTHVALIILDLRNNIVIGLVSLAAVGISLIDLTRWRPKDFDWYLDVGVRVPLDLATMYYHQPLRVPIIISWALDTRIREIFSDVIRRWT
jgi:hypothetical protein